MSELAVQAGDWVELTEKGAARWDDPLVSWGPRRGDVALVLKAVDIGTASTRNHATGSLLRIYRMVRGRWAVADEEIRLRLDSLFQKTAKPPGLDLG